MNTEDTCSAASIQAGEDILGTGASGTVHWIGLEVRGAWRPKAIVDNNLPEPVQAWLKALKKRPDTRPLFVKQRGKRDRVTVWYAHVIEGRVHRFELDDVSEAPDLPWDELFQGRTRVGLTEERPIFVCTHSARDHCCGLHGAGVARALSKAAPGRVWQCTHLGGHRFAATLVALPEGVHYGRVRREEAMVLVAALDQRRVHDLDRLRGFVRYPVAVQAAVDSTRRELDLHGLDDVAVHGWTQDNGDTTVRLRAANTERVLVVRRIVGDTAIPKSCGADPSPPPAWDIRVGG